MEPKSDEEEDDVQYILSKKDKDQLLEHVSAIGKRKKNKYIPHPSHHQSLLFIQNCLNDTEMVFSARFAYRKLLGTWNIVGSDLIPFIRDCNVVPFHIFDLIIEILLTLTLPMPKILTGNAAKNRKLNYVSPDVKKVLFGYKQAFVDSQLLYKIIFHTLKSEKEVLERESNKRKEREFNYRKRGKLTRSFETKHRLKMKVVEIFTNLMEIEPPIQREGLGGTTDNHNDLMEAFDSSRVFSFVLSIISDLTHLYRDEVENEETSGRRASFLDNHFQTLLRFVSLVFKNENPNELVLSVSQSTMDNVNRYNRLVMRDIMEQELQQKKALRRKLPKRHSRWGGIFVQKLTTGETVLSKNKRKMPSYEKPPPFNRSRLLLPEPKIQISSVKVKKILKSFGEKFLNDYFEDFFAIVKTGVIDNKFVKYQRHFFCISQFMLGLNRCLQIVSSTSRSKEDEDDGEDDDGFVMEMDRVACILDKNIIIYVFGMLTEFQRGKEWVNLRYAVKLLREIFSYMSLMFRDVSDTKLPKRASQLLHSIMYDTSYSEALFVLLKKYKVNQNPRSFLEDLVFCVNDFLEILENREEVEGLRVKKKNAIHKLTIKTNESDKITVINDNGLEDNDEMELDKEEEYDKEVILEFDQTKGFSLLFFRDKFAHHAILEKYFFLLRNYASNSIELNNIIIKMFDMVVDDLRREKMLFTLSLFDIMQSILNDSFLREEGKNKKRNKMNKLLIEFSEGNLKRFNEYSEDADDKGISFSSLYQWDDYEYNKNSLDKGELKRELRRDDRLQKRRKELHFNEIENRIRKKDDDVYMEEVEEEEEEEVVFKERNEEESEDDDDGDVRMVERKKKRKKKKKKKKKKGRIIDPDEERRNKIIEEARLSLSKREEVIEIEEKPKDYVDISSSEEEEKKEKKKKRRKKKRVPSPPRFSDDEEDDEEVSKSDVEDEGSAPLIKNGILGSLDGEEMSKKERRRRRRLKTLKGVDEDDTPQVEKVEENIDDLELDEEINEKKEKEEEGVRKRKREEEKDEDKKNGKKVKKRKKKKKKNVIDDLE